MCDTTAAKKPKPLPAIKPYGDYAIDVTGLTFAYDANPSNVILKDLNLKLETGSRTLLIGANGSGKSTLLRILSGRHLTKPENAVKVLGMSAFRDTKLNFHRAYLDCDWGMVSEIYVILIIFKVIYSQLILYIHILIHCIMSQKL